MGIGSEAAKNAMIFIRLPVLGEGVFFDFFLDFKLIQSYIALFLETKLAHVHRTINESNDTMPAFHMV